MTDKILKTIIIKDVSANLVNYDKYVLIAFPNKPDGMSIDEWVMQNIKEFLYNKLLEAEGKDKRSLISIDGIEIEIAK
jgi:hypothetical protein